MAKQKKYIPILISNNPKTILLLDSKLSKKERERRIANYLDSAGKLKAETPADYFHYDT